jgi:hypothetical protein
MSDFKLKLGINKCTNAEYHGDKRFLSSSSYKLLLKDPSKFEEEFIKGNRPEISSRTQNIFDEGTLAHSLILEPDTVEHEFEFFQGFRKSGKDWEDFKLQHQDSNKILMSKAQKIKVERWVAACQKRELVLKLIEGGFPEHTIAGDFLGIPTKVRADYINVDKGYIVDVKTTSYGSDVDSFIHTVNDFGYDISAALYCKLFGDYYNKDFSFYFYVLGKRDASCEVFKASEATLQKGLGKLREAASLYKKCKKTGIWKVSGKHEIVENEDYEILEV